MKRKVRQRLRRCVSSALLACLLVGSLTPGAQAQAGDERMEPHADFDWSVAAQYIDRDSDGLRDPARNATDMAEKYVVTLDACTTTPPPSGFPVTYEWSVPTEPVSGSDCRFTTTFSAEVTSPIELIARSGKYWDSVIRNVTIRDYVVASLGDSYSSGEGVPHVRQNGTTSQDEWEDIQCHRSARSGTAQYAAGLEDQSAKSVVTFIHLACSGAESKGGLREPYPGQEPVLAKELRDCYDEEHDGGWLEGCSYQAQLPPVTAQITQLEEILGAERFNPHRVDQLLMTIGGNDIAFAELVNDCALSDCDTESKRTEMKKRLGHWGCSRSTSGADYWAIGSDAKVDRTIPCLPGRMRLLADRLHQDGRLVAHNNVYLLEYGDPTRNRLGGYCEDLAYDHFYAEIEEEESKWASEVIIPGLNGVLKKSAAEQRWNYVGGFFNASQEGHGVCADERSWFLNVDQSVAAQGNVKGFLHPNEAGQAAYGQFMANTIVSKGFTAPTPDISVRGIRINETHTPGVAPVIEIDDHLMNRARHILLDGQPYTSGTPIEAPGIHTLRIIVSDPSGFVQLYLPFTIADPNAPSPTEPSNERSISLVASSLEVPKGTSVALAGAIDGSADCMDEQVVKLKARVPGNPFRLVAKTTTDDAGQFAFNVVVKRTRDYRAIAPFNDPCLKARSSVIRIKTS